MCKYLLPSSLKSYISSNNLIRKGQLLNKCPKKMNMQQISRSPMQLKLEINRNQRQIIILHRLQQLKIKNLKIKRKFPLSKNPPNNQKPNTPLITQQKGKTQTKKLTLSNNRQVLPNRNSKISPQKPNSKLILQSLMNSLHSKR